MATKKKTALTELSNNTLCGESWLNHTSVYKTSTGATIRFRIDVANCHHRAYCEVLKNQEWKTLFVKSEVAGYDEFSYIRCTIVESGKYKPIAQMDADLNLLKKHFLKVYETAV